MTVRYLLLGIGGALVLAVTLHVFREVRARPAAVGARPGAGAQPGPAPADDAERPSAVLVPEPTGQPDPPPPVPDRLTAAELPQPAPVTEKGADARLDGLMAEANKAYDRAEYDEAKELARSVLQKSPGNIRMLRIMVSAACLEGDSATAHSYYQQLPVDPPNDRVQMRTRCARYGIEMRE